MLQKCANPSCSAPFRSLREGKLFLAESPPPESANLVSGSPPKIRRREHFWLCETCSVQFTLRFDAQRGMLTVPINHGIAPHFLKRAAAYGD
jgi:hypothetical protein